VLDATLGMDGRNSSVHSITTSMQVLGSMRTRDTSSVSLAKYQEMHTTSL